MEAQGSGDRSTAQRLALEEQIRSLNEEMRALRDTLVDGLIIIDDQKVIRSFNLAAERIFGYPAAEVIGRNVRMLMPDPYQAAHDGYVDNYVRGGKAKIIGIGREVMGLRRDGSTFPMHLAVGEMAHHGGRFFVGIVRDLTKEKETQAQLRQVQKLEAIGQLTGGIAHDFNNLLSILMMDLEALEETTPAGDPRRELVEEALEAARSGSQLTRQLLAFARKQALNPQAVNVNQFIGRVSGLLRRSLGESIKLETVQSDGLWHATVDPNQLEHALLNLALNARDAMPNGGRLTIEARNVVLDADYAATVVDVVPGEYVCVSVTDTGTGMPRHVIERAFEPFFTTKSDGKGTGMGLAMVYGFVKQSHGHVAIYSEPGLGTTVSLYFPRVREGEEESAPATPRTAATGRGTILLVEDFAQLRRRTRLMLEHLGYAVVEADNAIEALKWISEGRQFDVLFTDIAMPDMNGNELARYAWEISPGLKVVFASGHGDVGDVAGPGQASLLRKPYSQQEVSDVLLRLLDE
jgi:PAS domain S-box-containing protein